MEKGETKDFLKLPLSNNLRERLKKSRRSFNSPFIVPKRLKIDSQSEGGGKADPGTEAGDSQLPNDTCSAQNGVTTETENLCERMMNQQPDTSAVGRNEASLGVQHATEHHIQTPAKSPNPIPEKQQLLEEKEQLQREVREKEELLRRLKMVQMYRTKNNLAELGSLIQKWRKSSQALLYELQMALCSDSKLTLTQLIDSLAIEDRLLHYNRHEEDFIDG
ncbi:swi5-dependent recombination DNA repair protein 1 homolog isoform X2 [Rhincodon typus]|uniref:swi5-dependent recombination DNA repair protein 1 homolog isoform X2 n=1 Tax=Rhincodon typus TaxID=259920 RepID=UPI00202E8EB0|nr:swi5-dependent recombination DNA repair protein 1 homolog isoform X2 [Rhincodon typus]